MDNRNSFKLTRPLDSAHFRRVLLYGFTIFVILFIGLGSGYLLWGRN